MAVQHYQFEAIHPFTDGNGRTGRVLNLLFLIDQRLLDIPVLYLSRSILARKAEYYRLLHAVTAEARWEDRILYMLVAVSETSALDHRKDQGDSRPDGQHCRTRQSPAANLGDLFT
jgi:Fic family protein